MVADLAQKFLHVLLRHRHPLSVLFQHLSGRLPADLPDAALQSPDARLPGVSGNHLLQSLPADNQLALFQTVGLHLLGNQMLLGNVLLLILRVAADLDDLHPVQQGPGNSPQVIGCGNEKHLG